ncbi:MAG: hypothetical protein NTX88_10520, partial [Candidatus Atribacteria bacterium]|nr:hypothetical protein [Candidatus Atribacteria bacterium]
VLQLPAYSRLLKGDGTSFTPQIGYQREKGLFIEGNYEYLFSSNFFFQATLYYATLQKIHLSTDFVMEYPYLEARLFIDFWQDESSTIGGYVHYEKDNFSLWALGTENERFNDHIFSRSPQFIISYQSNNEKEGFFVETDLSAGNFSNDTHTTWREDVYFSTGYEKKDFGGKLFYHSINNTSLNDATAWGGKVWAEKDFSPQLNVGISYEYVQVNGEGIYSMKDQSWQEKRYFVRKKLEDCIDLEASYWESSQTFFLSVNLAGFDKKNRIESLFDEQEEFDLFELKRNK